MLSPSSKSQRAAKILAMGIGSYLVWYFAGPLAGEAGRYVFENYYYLLHGTPSVYSLEYWLDYMPLRGHVTHYSYKYGDMLCAALSAPFFYRFPDLLHYCIAGRTATNGSNSDERDVDDLASENLSQLNDLLTDELEPYERRALSLDTGRELIVSNERRAEENACIKKRLSLQRSETTKAHSIII